MLLLALTLALGVAASPEPTLTAGWEVRHESGGRLALARAQRTALLRALGDATDPEWSRREWLSAHADGLRALADAEAARRGELAVVHADDRLAADAAAQARAEVERLEARRARHDDTLAHARALDGEARAWAAAEAPAWTPVEWAPVGDAVAHGDPSAARYWYRGLGGDRPLLDAWVEARDAAAVAGDPGERLASARERLVVAEAAEAAAAEAVGRALDAFASVDTQRQHLHDNRVVASDVAEAGRILAMEAEAVIGRLATDHASTPSTDDLLDLWAMAGLGALAAGDPSTGRVRLAEAAAIARDADRSFAPDWPEPARSWAAAAVVDGPRRTVVWQVPAGAALWVDGQPRRDFGPNPLPAELALTPGLHLITAGWIGRAEVSHTLLRVRHDAPVAEAEVVPTPPDSPPPGVRRALPLAAGLRSGTQVQYGRVAPTVGLTARAGRTVSAEISASVVVYPDPLPVTAQRSAVTRPQLAAAVVLTPTDRLTPRVAAGAFVDPGVGAGPFADLGLGLPLPEGRLDLCSRLGVDVAPHFSGVRRALWALHATLWFSPRSPR